MKNEIKTRYDEKVFKKIINQYDISKEWIQRIGGNENIIYEVLNKAENYILRITHDSHRTLELLKGEIEFIIYLIEQGISIPTPLCFKEGIFVDTINNSGSNFYLTKFSKAIGQTIVHKDWNNNLVKSFGREIGKMHSLSQKYKLSDAKMKRPEWTGISAKINRNINEGQTVYDRYDKLIQDINKIPKSKESYGLVHGDIHFGNTTLNDGRITFLDFDDCSYNWYVNDIAIFLFYCICRHQKDTDEKEFIEKFIDNFFEGYYSQADLSEKQLSYIPTFLKLREFNLYLELIELDKGEYLNYEKAFMKNRKERLENGIPFVSFEF